MFLLRKGVFRVQITFFMSSDRPPPSPPPPKKKIAMSTLCERWLRKRLWGEECERAPYSPHLPHVYVHFSSMYCSHVILYALFDLSLHRSFMAGQSLSMSMHSFSGKKLVLRESWCLVSQEHVIRTHLLQPKALAPDSTCAVPCTSNWADRIKTRF